MNTSLEAKSIEELHELNIQITQRYRKSFRSWNYNEPDRWVYLSKSFADEVISSNPQFVQKSTEISKLFVENLTKRAEIYYSDAKNKKSLMEQASNEFKYNLCYVIGVEGFNSWQKNSREIYQEFSQTRDSLKLILAIETEKRKTSKTQKP
ncbi:MAG: hypothetical protein JXR48_04385 [Candidatus Delongbacteria bacterium]|nr:hypothetical protein [Candidatus Delongbacteria bacterium]